MKIFLLMGLFLLTSCATKYLVPGNRFMTPETNGGAFKGQIEFQQATANQLSIDTSDNTVDKGVLYEKVTRTAFMYSNSFFDNFDLYWEHMASANSIIGLKFQVVGDPRESRSEGHKIAIALGFGMNEHETDDSSVEFKLSGREVYALYGYRFNEMILTYASLAHYAYSFQGEIVGGRSELRGLEPKFETGVLNLNGGIELSVGPVLAKFEGTYQQIETSDTKDKEQLIFGWSLGYSW